PPAFSLTFHYHHSAVGPVTPVFPREVRPSRYRRNRKSSNNSLSFCNYSTLHATRSPRLMSVTFSPCYSNPLMAAIVSQDKYLTRAPPTNSHNSARK
ncbi:unnamed protein product, partial [Tenebrio molitor]